MYKIVLMEKMKTLLYRVENIMNNEKCRVITVGSALELYKTLKQTNELNAIIVDLDGEEEYGIPILRRINELTKGVPIFVMTSMTLRSFFVEAMLEGATDFIRKPFKDITLTNKVLSYINKNILSNKLITFSLPQYIKGEFRKAQKGNFQLSILFMYFRINMASEDFVVNTEKIHEYLYRNLQTLFWETDIFFKFGSQYYMGIFPFCNDTSTRIISNKVDKKFEQLKSQNKDLYDCTFYSTYVSFPNDSDNLQTLQTIFTNRVKQQVGNQSIDIYFI